MERRRPRHDARLRLSRWFTTRYRVTDDRVEVRTGLFRRRVLAVLARPDPHRRRHRPPDAPAARARARRGRHRAVRPRGRRRRAARRPHRGRGRRACARSCCTAVSRPCRRRRWDRRAAHRGARDGAGAPRSALDPVRALHAVRHRHGRRGRGFLANLANEAHFDPERSARAARCWPMASTATGRAHHRRDRGRRCSCSWWSPRRSATSSRSGTSGSRATAGGTLHVTRGLITTRRPRSRSAACTASRSASPCSLRMVGAPADRHRHRPARRPGRRARRFGAPPAGSPCRGDAGGRRGHRQRRTR